jgi:branched-chain amino acid transport system substrate-binding protein
MMLQRTFRIAVALCAIGIAAVSSARAAGSADPIEINAIVSLAGRFAALGQAQVVSMHAMETMLNKSGGINGRPVHFNIQDDQSQPEVALQIANGVIAKHAQVLLGPTGSTSCSAIAALFKTNGPVNYCFAPTIHPAAGSFIFSSGASSRDQAVEALVFARAKGWKRLATIATTDVTGADNEEQFNDVLATGKYGATSIVAHERFGAADVTVSAQLARIKAANPDAILVLTVGTPTGTVLRGLKDSGLDRLPIVSILGNLTHTTMNSYADLMPAQMYFTAPRFYARSVSRPGPVRDAQNAFYKALAPQTPDVGNNNVWDPALIVISALRKLGPDADAKTLLNYMLTLHDFAGTNGIFDFRGGDQRGQALSTLVMVKWDPKIKDVTPVSEPGGKPL